MRCWDTTRQGGQCTQSKATCSRSRILELVSLVSPNFLQCGVRIEIYVVLQAAQFPIEGPHELESYKHTSCTKGGCVQGAGTRQERSHAMFCCASHWVPVESGKKPGTYAGAALHDARRSKERTYPELLNNRRCRLVVLGIEVGGRWSNEASNFICMLAKARARSSPPSLQAATSAALVSRWSALLTHAAATSFAASLLFEDLCPPQPP